MLSTRTGFGARILRRDINILDQIRAELSCEGLVNSVRPLCNALETAEVKGMGRLVGVVAVVVRCSGGGGESGAARLHSQRAISRGCRQNNVKHKRELRWTRTVRGHAVTRLHVESTMRSAHRCLMLLHRALPAGQLSVKRRETHTLCAEMLRR